MKCVFRILLCSVVSSGVASGQPLDYYINNGAVTNAQVDARVFINNGQFMVFDTFGSAPFESQNTGSYTNYAQMFSSSGFRFDLVPAEGARMPSTNFVNAGSGTIDTSYGYIILGSGILGSGIFYGVNSPSIRVWSSNIVNRGEMRVGAGGLIRLQGDNVDLFNGRLIVDPVGGFLFDSFFGCSPTLGGFISPTNFYPDIGIYDEYWGMGTTTNLDVTQLLFGVNPTFVQSPLHNVTNQFFNYQNSIFLSDASSWVFVARPDSSNVVVHSVFVETQDTNIVPDVRFARATYPGGTTPGNSYFTPIVEFQVYMTNAITATRFTNTLYLVDQLATGTNFNILPNAATREGYRPAAYVLTRTEPCGFQLGAISNAVAGFGMFDDPTFTSTIVTNTYAAYAATIDSLPSRPIIQTSVTNLPGRVEILANDLNLTRTRIRGEGLVSIRASNSVATSALTVVDVENVAMGLTAASGLLQVTNMVRPSVDRFHGSMAMWSGAWTNSSLLVVTNIVPDPGNPGATLTNIVTNITQYAYHTTFVDAGFLRSKKPVTVSEFFARATNAPSRVEISDPLKVQESFRIEAQNLTVNGLLDLSGGIQLGSTNLIGTRNFTVNTNGLLLLPGLIALGSDRTEPFDNVINRGSIAAYSHSYRANYFENRGSLISGEFFFFGLTNFYTNFFFSTAGPIRVDAETAKLEGGRISTLGTVTFAGQNTKFSQHSTEAANGLYLEVTGSLADSGPGSSNIWVVGSGVHFIGQTKPAGDLLGTTIYSSTERFEMVEHEWPALDRGATVSGFVNNLAVGTLVLGGGLDSVFVFQPPAGATDRALYIDRLVLTGTAATDFANTVFVQPGYDVYFADVVVMDVSPTSVVDAHDFDPGGRFEDSGFHWVPDFSGPNSSVDVPLSPVGPTIPVNRSLRFSDRLDSDGDGVVNRDDEFPFGETVPSLTLMSTAGAELTISWQALPNALYRVEEATSLEPGNWTQITTVESGPGFETLSVPVPIGSGQRYYRVKFSW